MQGGTCHSGALDPQLPVGTETWRGTYSQVSSRVAGHVGQHAQPEMSLRRVLDDLCRVEAAAVVDDLEERQRVVPRVHGEPDVDAAGVGVALAVEQALVGH